MIYLGIYGRPLAPCWIIIDHSKQIDKLDQVAAGGAKVRVTTSMARNATDVSNRYPIDIGLNRKAATSLRQSSLFSFSKNAPAIKRKRAGKMDRVHRCIDPPYTPVIHTRYTHPLYTPRANFKDGRQPINVTRERVNSRNENDPIQPIGKHQTNKKEINKILKNSDIFRFSSLRRVF